MFSIVELIGFDTGGTCCAIKAFAKPPKNLSLLIVLFKVREHGLNRK